MESVIMNIHLFEPWERKNDVNIVLDALRSDMNNIGTSFLGCWDGIINEIPSRSVYKQILTDAHKKISDVRKASKVFLTIWIFRPNVLGSNEYYTVLYDSQLDNIMLSGPGINGKVLYSNIGGLRWRDPAYQELWGEADCEYGDS